MDVVSSYRVKAYCDHLKLFDIKPTLLTHRWEKVGEAYVKHQPDDAVLIEENENCRIIRLPYPGTDRPSSMLKKVWCYINGNLDVDLVTDYRVFKRFLWSHLKANRYQLIIALYNPHFHLKLAYECRKKFGIPYVLDFRDLWDNEVVTKSYRPRLKKRLLDLMISWWWRKWIVDSLFFSTTGNKWRDFLFGLSKCDGIVVRNGYEKLDRTDIAKFRPGAKFKVIHFGRIYRTQNVDVFLSGFGAFASNHLKGEIFLEIIGLKKIAEVDYEKKLRDRLGDLVTFVPYMPKEKLLEYCRSEAALFFFPNFQEDNGQFPVKIYDYIALGKNVIVSPDGGEAAEVVRKVKAGAVFNTAEEVASYLETSYCEFLRDGAPALSVDSESLNSYSREAQVRLMALKIHSVLSEEK